MHQNLSKIIVSAAVSLVIFIIAPFISISGNNFFAEIWLRGFLTVIIFLGVLSLFYFEPLKQSLHYFIKNNYSFLPAYDDTSIIIDQQIKIALDFLKKKHLHRRPVYLLIGPKGCGKTTLLAQSDLKILLEVPKKSIDLHPNECQWYFADIGIFIEVPDYFIQGAPEKRINPWQKLLKKLHKHHLALPIKHIIVAHDLNQMLKASEESRQLFYHLCRERFSECYNITKTPLSLYLVLTKCDTLQGFYAYFQTLNKNKRNELLSVITSDIHNLACASIDLKSYFELKFNDLSAALNDNLLENLHHEWNEKLRLEMADFPHQFDSLRSPLLGMVYHLAEKSAMAHAAYLQGVFFTSALQEAPVIDNLGKSQDFVPAVPYLTQTGRPYHFIGSLFEEISKNLRQEIPAPLVSLKFTRAALAGMLILICGALVFRFTNNLMTLNKAQMQLAKYALNPQKDQTLLAKADNLLARAKLFWVFSITTKTEKKSDAQQLVNTAPKTIITESKPIATPQLQPYQTVVPREKAFLELLSSEKLVPDQQYNVLKAYLMWHNQIKFNPKFIAQLNRNLQSANLSLPELNSSAAQASINDTTIRKIRSDLKALPSAQLAYIIFKSHHLKLLNHSIDMGFTETKIINIPELYTAKGLLMIFNQDYKKLINAAIIGNLVLGPISNPANDELIQGFFANYLNDYRDWWQLQLNKAFSFKADNLSSLNAQLHTVNQNTFNEFLRIIDINLNFPVILNNQVFASPKDKAIFTDEVNKIMLPLQSFQNLTVDQINAIDKVLNQIKNDLQHIVANRDQNYAAYNYLLNGLENNSAPSILQIAVPKSIPDSIFSGLSQILNQAQNFMLQAARSYLNEIWQAQVYTLYQRSLADRFPIDPHGSQDITLSAFQNFFAPDGAMLTFFNQYLLPFIDANQPRWQWKTLANGKTLGFSAQVLATFERAKIISTMFFPKNDNTLSVQFTLQQKALMPIVKTLKLNINGQTLSDAQGTKNISEFIWPGNANEDTATVNFLNINGQEVKSHFEGPWAWFRLLAHESVEPTEDPQKFNITFNIDGIEARYWLTAQTPINPFIPEIVNQFRCERVLG